MECPNCDKRLNLKKWWKSCRRRTDIVCEYQVKYVANNIGRGIDPKTHKKYKQSERILKRLGFYDDFGI